jgi:hypothetical protein
MRSLNPSDGISKCPMEIFVLLKAWLAQTQGRCKLLSKSLQLPHLSKCIHYQPASVLFFCLLHPSWPILLLKISLRGQKSSHHRGGMLLLLYKDHACKSGSILSLPIKLNVRNLDSIEKGIPY